MIKSFLAVFILLFISYSSFGQSISVGTKAGKLSFPEDFRYQGPELGKKFPDFTYKDIEGNVLSFNQLENKIVILNIWFVGCTGCKEEEPYLKKLVEHFSDNHNVVFISFSMSNEEKIKKHYQKHGNFGYKTISLDRKHVNQKYQVVTSPTHFIIKDGILLEKFTVPITHDLFLNWFKTRIENL
jgi:peroxiredoxin